MTNLKTGNCISLMEISSFLLFPSWNEVWIALCRSYQMVGWFVSKSLEQSTAELHVLDLNVELAFFISFVGRSVLKKQWLSYDTSADVVVIIISSKNNRDIYYNSKTEDVFEECLKSLWPLFPAVIRRCDLDFQSILIKIFGIYLWFSWLLLCCLHNQTDK